MRIKRLHIHTNGKVIKEDVSASAIGSSEGLGLDYSMPADWQLKERIRNTKFNFKRLTLVFLLSLLIASPGLAQWVSGTITAILNPAGPGGNPNVGSSSQVILELSQPLGQDFTMITIEDVSAENKLYINEIGIGAYEGASPDPLFRYFNTQYSVPTGKFWEGKTPHDLDGWKSTPFMGGAIHKSNDALIQNQKLVAITDHDLANFIEPNPDPTGPAYVLKSFEGSGFDPDVSSVVLKGGPVKGGGNTFLSTDRQTVDYNLNIVPEMPPFAVPIVVLIFLLGSLFARKLRHKLCPDLKIGN